MKPSQIAAALLMVTIRGGALRAPPGGPCGNPPARA